MEKDTQAVKTENVEVHQNDAQKPKEDVLVEKKANQVNEAKQSPNDKNAKNNAEKSDALVVTSEDVELQDKVAKEEVEKLAPTNLENIKPSSKDENGSTGGDVTAPYLGDDDDDVFILESDVKEPSKKWAIISLFFAFIMFIGFTVALIFFFLLLYKAPLMDPRVIKDQAPRQGESIIEYIPFEALACAIAFGFLGLTYMCLLAGNVLRQPVGVEDIASGMVDKLRSMYKISNYISEGARSFLFTEGVVLVIFVAWVTVILLLLQVILYFISDYSHKGIIVPTPICFVIGAITSGATAVFGMLLATQANVRTANAARTSLEAALHVAFDGGAFMGLAVTGLGLLSLASLYMIFRDVTALAGFGFGASSIALFARVGGGIYTKAADVGADLVGKVEAGIPEDDPRNPATIADNVGDNVGDVAGMGADLFESYCGSIIAAATLGSELFQSRGIALPFYLASGGILCSIIGTTFVSTGVARFLPFPRAKNASQVRLLWAVRKGIIVAAVLNLIVACAIIFGVFYDQPWPTSVCLFLCYFIGLFAGVSIGFCTEYFTSDVYTYVQSIANAGLTGPATVVIKGLSVGMISCAPVVLIVASSILGCMYLGDLATIDRKEYGSAGVYGIAIAAVGMLSTLGVTLATDAFGPIADNAGGLAEMAQLPSEIRDRTDALDSLGNTTAATGKGFAIGSAVLTSLALMSAFTRSGKLDVIDVLDQRVMFGMLVGALLPFVFASQTMNAVNVSAMSVIEEVRHQFKTKVGLLEGKVEADHRRCVAICTRASLREMIAPGTLAVIAPVVIGFAGRQRMLAGLLAGSITTGFLLGTMMSNAGGAWDNAKKFVEAKGIPEDYDEDDKRIPRKEGIDWFIQKIRNDAPKVARSEIQMKNSECHKACVVGDTIGDPFKDTSGPSLNILIKLISIISLTIAPILAVIYQNE